LGRIRRRHVCQRATQWTVAVSCAVVCGELAFGIDLVDLDGLFLQILLPVYEPEGESYECEKKVATRHTSYHRTYFDSYLWIRWMLVWIGWSLSVYHEQSLHSFIPRGLLVGPIKCQLRVCQASDELTLCQH